MRTREDIKTDYQKLCFELGAKTYNAKALEQDIQGLLVKMSAINEEALGLQNGESAPKEVDHVATLN